MNNNGGVCYNIERALKQKKILYVCDRTCGLFVFLMLFLLLKQYMYIYKCVGLIV